jgi:ABC-type multidrug transport system permease subunit
MVMLRQLTNLSLSSGLYIQCRNDEFAIFDPPVGQTCGQWAQEFADVVGGYIENANATVGCQYCQFRYGDEFYTPLNIAFGNRWRDAFILFAFFGELLLPSVKVSSY